MSHSAAKGPSPRGEAARSARFCRPARSCDRRQWGCAPWLRAGARLSLCKTLPGGIVAPAVPHGGWASQSGQTSECVCAAAEPSAFTFDVNEPLYSIGELATLREMDRLLPVSRSNAFGSAKSNSRPIEGARRTAGPPETKCVAERDPEFREKECDGSGTERAKARGTRRRGTLQMHQPLLYGSRTSTIVSLSLPKPKERCATDS